MAKTETSFIYRSITPEDQGRIVGLFASGSLYFGFVVCPEMEGRDPEFLYLHPGHPVAENRFQLVNSGALKRERCLIFPNAVIRPSLQSLRFDGEGSKTPGTLHILPHGIFAVIGHKEAHRVYPFDVATGDTVASEARNPWCSEWEVGHIDPSGEWTRLFAVDALATEQPS